MAKAELEDLGEDTEGMVTSTSQLRDLIKGMTGFDIMKNENEFKDLYDIIIGIGKEWKNLTDIQQASLLEKLAGKRAGNQVAAALNNIDIIERAYATAENSGGSAMEEQQKYMEGIQYSVDKLKATWQEFWSTLINTKDVKTVIELLNGIIEKATVLVKNIGPVFTVLGTLGGLKGIEILLDSASGGKFGEMFKSRGGIFGQILGLLTGSKGNISNNTSNNNEDFYYSNNVNDIFVADFANEVQGADKVINKFIGSNTALGKVLTKLSGFFNISKGAVLGWAGALASTAYVTYKIVTSGKEIAETAEKVGKAYKETSDNLSSYEDKVKALYSTIKDEKSSLEEVTNARKELIKVQNEMIDLYKDENGEISSSALNTILEATDSITGSAEKATEAIKKLKAEAWEKAEKDLEDSGFWSSIGKRIRGIFESGYDNKKGWSGFDEMYSQYNNRTIRLETGIDSKLAKLYEKFGLKKTTGGTTTEGNINYEITGSPEEIQKTLKEIQSAALEFDVELNTDFDKEMSANSNIIEKYSNMWNAYIENKIFNNDDYADTFKKLTDEYEKYNEARIKGDSKASEESLKNIQKIYEDFENLEFINEDDYNNIVTYFQNMDPVIQKAVDDWNIKVKLNPEIGDASNVDLVKEGVSYLKKYSVEELKTKDLSSYSGPEIDGIDKLKEAAEGLGLNPQIPKQWEHFIDILKDLDYVSEYSLLEVKTLATSITQFGKKSKQVFGTDYFRDILVNYGAEGGNAKYLDQINKALEDSSTRQKTLNLLSNNWLATNKNIKATVEATSKILANIKADPMSNENSIKAFGEKSGTSTKSINSAYDTLFENGKLNKDKLDSSFFEGLGSGFDDAREKLNAAGKDVTIFNTKVEKLYNDLNNGDSEAVKEDFNDLDSYIISSTNALSGLKEENKNLYKNLLEAEGYEKKSVDKYVDYWTDALKFDNSEAKAKFDEQLDSIIADYNSKIQEGADPLEVEVDLTEAISQLQKEGEAAGLSKEEIDKYIEEKTGANFDIITSGTVAQLEQEGIWARDTADAWREYHAAKSNGAVTGSSKGKGSGAGYTSDEIADANSEARAKRNTMILNKMRLEKERQEREQALQDDASKLQRRVPGGTGGGGGGGAADEAADAWVDAYTKAKEQLKKLEEEGKIDTVQYLNAMRALYERYYKGIGKYQEQFFEEQKEYLEGKVLPSIVVIQYMKSNYIG